MMKRFLQWLFAGLIFLAHPAFSQDQNIHIVFIPKSSDQVFWDFMRDGVETGLREIGKITLTWRGPAYNDDTDSQIKILEAYARPGVDAIVIAPTDRRRLVAPIRKAAAMGIKIIVVDSALDGKYHENFITTNNQAAGTLAARQLCALLHARGKVIVFRTVPGSASTDDRADAFIDYVKKNAPAIEIVADAYGGGSRGKAMHSASALLKNHSDIAGIFAVNESASDGMLRALQEADLAGKVRFVGFDSTNFLLRALEKNEIDALLVQNPRQMGYFAIKAAVAAIRHAPIADKTVFTDATLVTRENYESPEIRALLIP